MGTILLLALAAAVYPQLLAVVVVILTRPNPRPLLWACYLGSVVVSIGASVAIVAIFRSRGAVAGTTSHRLSPATYVVAGVIAVAVAIFVATPRGRDLMGRDPFGVRRRRQRGPDRVTAAARIRSRAEEALRDGSMAVAAVVGALLAVPGPFDLIALGRLARGGYGALTAGIVIVVITVIKFALIEAPIVSYTVDPDGTAASVGRFSAWMHDNKLGVVVVIVAVVGVLLIGKGLSRMGGG
jgi:hypothetical protein